jgi:hypothetical protein
MTLSRFKLPEDDASYAWTRHVKQKMLHYRMSPSLVKRIIRHPARMEEGIAPGTVAVMQPARTKRAQEFWVMYAEMQSPSKRRRVITAWRYPGISPVREVIPIPDDIVRELEESGEL